MTPQELHNNTEAILQAYEDIKYYEGFGHNPMLVAEIIRAQQALLVEAREALEKIKTLPCTGEVWVKADTMSDKLKAATGDVCHLNY